MAIHCRSVLFVILRECLRVFVLMLLPFFVSSALCLPSHSSRLTPHSSIPYGKPTH